MRQVVQALEADRGVEASVGCEVRGILDVGVQDAVGPITQQRLRASQPGRANGDVASGQSEERDAERGRRQPSPSSSVASGMPVW
ncbi:hypothetical protein GCM10023152_35520 [Agromyces bauzanensis]|uniref:Uncharacterized protein n=1 Tax=Agromyces bauzanensis TaxID=1308924 RepID=A0A917USM5_9MICO|nr:hypothetical protein GCM10011372_20760 [Agromyces bauzanensis]